MAKLDANVEISAAEVKEALTRPKYFMYYGPNEEMFHTWSLGPLIRTRDSGLLDEANAQALENHLNSDKSLKNDWMIETMNHALVGWVDYLTFRAVEKDGKTPTRIFRVLKQWNDDLSDYPLADEELYSQLEWEAALNNIENEGRNLVNDDAPSDEWPGFCYHYWMDKDPSVLENEDGHGGYLDRDQIMECLAEKGWLDDYYYEDEDDDD